MCDIGRNGLLVAGLEASVERWLGRHHEADRTFDNPEQTPIAGGDAVVSA